VNDETAWEEACVLAVKTEWRAMREQRPESVADLESVQVVGVAPNSKLVIRLVHGSRTRREYEFGLWDDLMSAQHGGRLVPEGVAVLVWTNIEEAD